MKLATLSYEMRAGGFRSKIGPLKLPRPVIPAVPEQVIACVLDCLIARLPRPVIPAVPEQVIA
eukprot:5124140-Prymnesium_polylepis.3